MHMAVNIQLYPAIRPDLQKISLDPVHTCTCGQQLDMQKSHQNRCRREVVQDLGEILV